MHARGRKLQPQVFAGGISRALPPSQRLSLVSRKDGQCTVEILCAKSGASGAHLNHVGGALKAIKTPERPRTAGPSMREISVLDRDASTCLHCFNNSTLRPPRLLRNGWHIIVYLVTIDTVRNSRPTGIVGRLVKSRRSRSIQPRTKDPRVVRISFLLGLTEIT